MAVQIGTMAVVFGLIFKSEMSEYLPFITLSIIFWGFLASVLNEGCQAFIAGEAIIKQVHLPFYVHIVRVVWRNVVVLGHNSVIVPVVLLVVGSPTGFAMFLAVPGLILTALNLTWMGWLLAMVSARYRDMPPIVFSMLTVALYLTPVMWYPRLIGDDVFAHFLLGLNPFYHLLQLVRLPLLNQVPTPENWLIALSMAGLGWLLVLAAMKKYRSKIAYWV